MPRFHISNIVYELTGACNQCCRFCYNHWRPEGAPAPDPARARKTLRKLLSQCSVGTISFSGGEPLLLPNIHDLMLRARLRGSHVNVLTNGTLLTQDALDNFVSLGVSAIQIPLLSADAEVHDYLTCVSGSWEKAVDATRRAGSKGVTVLVITKLNAPGVEETLSLIRDCGIRTVMVNRFNIGGNGIRNMRELVPDSKTLASAFAAIEAFAAAHPDMRFVSGVCTPLCFLDTTPYPHIKFTKCSTELTGRPVTINYSGDVRFCNHSPRVLGNIYSRPISDILQDPDINALYAGMPADCSDCHLLERCGGGCRAASEQLYGTFSRKDPIIDVV